MGEGANLVCVFHNSSMGGSWKSLVVQMQREHDLQRPVAAHLEGNEEKPHSFSDRHKKLHIFFSTLCAIALQQASFATPDLQGDASQANPWLDRTNPIVEIHMNTASNIIIVKL